MGVTVVRAGPPFHAARLPALEHPGWRPAPGPTGGPQPTAGSMEPRTVGAHHPRSSACIQRSLEVPAVTGEKKGGSVPQAAVGRLWARARRRLRSAGCSPARGAERGCRTVQAPPEPHADQGARKLGSVPWLGSLLPGNCGLGTPGSAGVSQAHGVKVPPWGPRGSLSPSLSGVLCKMGVINVSTLKGQKLPCSKCSAVSLALTSGPAWSEAAPTLRTHATQRPCP